MKALKDQLRAMSMLLGQLRQVHATTQRVVGDLQAGAKVVRAAALDTSADGLPVESINAALAMSRWASDAEAWRRKLGADIHAIAQWIHDAQRYAQRAEADDAALPLPYSGASPAVQQAYARAAAKLTPPAAADASRPVGSSVDWRQTIRDRASAPSDLEQPMDVQLMLAAAAGVLVWSGTGRYAEEVRVSPWGAVAAHWVALHGAVTVMADCVEASRIDGPAAGLRIEALARQWMQSGGIAMLLHAARRARETERIDIVQIARECGRFGVAAQALPAGLDKHAAAFDRLHDRARFLRSKETRLVPVRTAIWSAGREVLFARLVQQICFNALVDEARAGDLSGAAEWTTVAALIHPLPGGTPSADGSRDRRQDLDRAAAEPLETFLDVVKQAAVECDLASTLARHPLGVRGACYALLLAILRNAATQRAGSTPASAHTAPLLRHPRALKQRLLEDPGALHAALNCGTHTAIDARLRAFPPLARWFLLGAYIPSVAALDQLATMMQSADADAALAALAPAVPPAPGSSAFNGGADPRRVHREIDHAIGAAFARWRLSSVSSGAVSGRP